MTRLPARDPGARTAAHEFWRVAEETPSRSAVRHGSTELSYAELAGLAGGVADQLRAQGVARGDVVATLLDRSPACVVAVLGAWAAGAAYVHIEPTDPDARVRTLLDTVAPRAVLTDQQNRARLPSGPYAICSLTGGPPCAAYHVCDGVSRDDLAYLVFTSGSTGVPKVVEIAHRALLSYYEGFWSIASGIGPLSSFGVTTTFAADIGKASVFGALLSGGRLDIYDRDTTLDPQRLAAELLAYPVDAMTYTPSLLEALASDGEIAGLLPRRLVYFIGEALPPRLITGIFAAAPHIEVFNGYGPAEATIVVTVRRATPADGTRERVPIGFPLPGVVGRILDDNQRLVADGTPGVLYLGGECLSRGYRGDAQKTAAKFVTVDGERLYRTDDLVCRTDDGSLDYLGRVDCQLKIRGNRVEPGEVEAALHAVPGVRLAAVTGERSRPSGPLEIAAYVVGTATRSEIVQSLSERLPAALIPSRIHLVADIPLNMNGKADLSSLSAAIEPAAPPVRGPDQPAGTTELIIAEIWQEVLGVAHVGRHVRFVEAGGTSFKAVAVFGRLRRHFPGFTIAQLYAHPTIAELAGVMGGPNEEALPRTTMVEL